MSRGKATRVQCADCGKVDAIRGRLSMKEIQEMQCDKCDKKRGRKVSCKICGEVGRIERDVDSEVLKNNICPRCKGKKAV